MSALLVRTLRKTPLDDNLTEMVLKWIEGFAPSGVEKAFWKKMLSEWRFHSDGCARVFNPAEVWKEIENKNKEYGPQQWCMSSNGAMALSNSAINLSNGARRPVSSYLRAELPINRQLEGKHVQLYRSFKNYGRSLFPNYSNKRVKILQVNDNAFRHTWPRAQGDEVEYWCKKESKLLGEIPHAYVEVQFSSGVCFNNIRGEWGDR